MAKKPPELALQQHIADYLIRKQKFDLLDHIIFNGNGYFSFLEEGNL